MILHTASRAARNLKSDLSIEVVILKIDFRGGVRLTLNNPKI